MRFLKLLILFIFSSASIFAAEKNFATALPDISFIGVAGVRTYIDSNENKDVSFTFDSFEINAMGYMHPNVRADFVFGADSHEGNIEFEVEEAYATFSNLSFSTGVKVGRKLLDFGRINHIHPHEWLFLNAPFVLSNFLGEHSLLGDGAVVDVLLPFPFFMNVQAGIWRIPTHEHSEEEETQPFSPAGEIYNIRLWSSFEVGENSELEFGMSGLKGHGAHYTSHTDRIQMAGADITFKTWPSAYSRIMLLAEVVYLERELPIGFIGRWGMYVYLGYRIDKQWETAIKYDWSETANPEDEKKSGISLIGSYYISESLKLRSEYLYCPEMQSHTGLIKVIFGIGPHTHPLQ